MDVDLSLPVIPSDPKSVKARTTYRSGDGKTLYRTADRRVSTWNPVDLNPRQYRKMVRDIGYTPDDYSEVFYCKGTWYSFANFFRDKYAPFAGHNATSMFTGDLLVLTEGDYGDTLVLLVTGQW